MERASRRLEGEVASPPGLPAVAGARIAELRYPAHLVLPRHHHDGGLLCYAVRGGFREEGRRATFEAGAGALTWQPPGEPHRNRVAAGGLLGLRIELDPGLLAALPALAEGEPRLARGGAAASFASALVRETRRAEDALPIAIESLLRLILAELMREGALRSRGAPAWLRRVRERLHEEPAAIPSLAHLARGAGVHPGHLARAFRSHFGSTIGDYVRERRLELARCLLRRGDEPLAGVAVRCGFADQSHLGRAFKRRYGVSPGAFRRGAVEP